MKLSRQWLGDFTDITCSDKEFSERMTMTGSKVEGWEITGSTIRRVVAGRVLEIERHPDSDHMWICKIDAGTHGTITIVTGAQNVSAGDMVPVARDGSTLANGTQINASVLRGVESQGMLCSLKELGLDTYDYPYAIDDGIFIMNEPCSPGDDIISVLGLGDSVVEFEITNNRPDCLSVRGLAREAAATFGTHLKLADPVPVSGTGAISDYLSIEIADSDLCPRYTAKMVRNIKIEPSPAWMRRRLRASGVRPINNIVDITNYVMLEYGQPMHAFDYSCVGGGKIIVRRAKDGEPLQTLDGNDRKLTSHMLVIADESVPVGIAGVMGGANSEITGRTNTVVFESANFNGTSIRKTSIGLGMRTDASGRYEKGLDPNNTVPAIERACELVELLGAGEVIGGTIDIVAESPQTVTLPLEPERVNALVGADMSHDFMVKCLESIGFAVSGDMITVPSWRSDVEHFADIAEELARFYGYDAIEATMFSGSADGGYSERQDFERGVGSLCRSMGYYQVMTYSFTSPLSFDRIRLPGDSPLRRVFTIQNPLGEDTSVMRTTSLPSMMEVLTWNFNKRNVNVRLYEMATVYKPVDGQELADERMVLTLGAYGHMSDFFGVKGSIEALLAGMRIDDVSFTACTDNPSYHPGRCAVIRSGDTVIGVMGQVHLEVCSEYGIDCEICTAELDIDLMMGCRGEEPSYVPLPRFPSVIRDIALVCDRGIPVSELSATIRSAGGNLKGCELFDVYTGAPIPEGKKSVAFSLTLRADDITLTDELASETIDTVLAKLKNSHDAVIR